LKLIELGRGARQGDPIASILFVLAIEILLIAIRNNPNIEPYRYEALSAVDTPISNKVGAYADDVNIMMPRSEASIRETISTLCSYSLRGPRTEMGDQDENSGNQPLLSRSSRVHHSQKSENSKGS